MRWKLMSGNLIVLLLVSVLAWLMVRSSVGDALVRDADGSVQRSIGLFQAVRSAEGERFNAEAAAASRRPDAASIFALTSEREQNSAAFQLAGRLAEDIGTRYPVRSPHAADVVAIIRADGRVIARNVDQNQDRGRNLRNEYESIAFALDGAGHPARDVIRYDGQSWYDVAISPVVSEGQVRGAVLIGYEIADTVARDDRDRLGVDVGYLLREGNGFRLHSLSFGTQSDKDELRRWANGTEANLATVFSGESAAPVRDVVIRGQTYRATAAAMPGIFRRTRAGETRPGFVVLQNVSALRAPATGSTLPILLFALGGLLLLAVFNIMVGNYLERPIEQIEESLLRIINGDRDHRIELQHAELGGVVYRINQLVAELTGADETDDSGRISHPPPPPTRDEAPVGAPLIDESGITTPDPKDIDVAQRLAVEPENEYYERLRREHVAARQKLGQGGDGMTHEQFVETVRSSEQALAQKHALTAVRFAVVVQGNQIVFRAVPIR